jgi:hypothetical protein
MSARAIGNLPIRRHEQFRANNSIDRLSANRSLRDSSPLTASIGSRSCHRSAFSADPWLIAIEHFGPEAAMLVSVLCAGQEQPSTRRDYNATLHRAHCSLRGRGVDHDRDWIASFNHLVGAGEHGTSHATPRNARHPGWVALGLKVSPKPTNARRCESPSPLFQQIRRWREHLSPSSRRSSRFQTNCLPRQRPVSQRRRPFHPGTQQ